MAKNIVLDVSREWWLDEVESAPSIIDNMSEEELDEALTLFDINIGPVIASARHRFDIAKSEWLAEQPPDSSDKKSADQSILEGVHSELKIEESTDEEDVNHLNEDELDAILAEFRVDVTPTVQAVRELSLGLERGTEPLLSNLLHMKVKSLWGAGLRIPVATIWQGGFVENSLFHRWSDISATRPFERVCIVGSASINAHAKSFTHVDHNDIDVIVSSTLVRDMACMTGNIAVVDGQHRSPYIGRASYATGYRQSNFVILKDVESLFNGDVLTVVEGCHGLKSTYQSGLPSPIEVLPSSKHFSAPLSLGQNIEVVCIYERPLNKGEMILNLSYKNKNSSCAQVRRPIAKEGNFLLDGCYSTVSVATSNGLVNIGDLESLINGREGIKGLRLATGLLGSYFCSPELNGKDGVFILVNSELECRSTSQKLTGVHTIEETTLSGDQSEYLPVSSYGKKMALAMEGCAVAPETPRERFSPNSVGEEL